MTETYKREVSDTSVSIGHQDLVANLFGWAREIETGDGDTGVLIFIPTSAGPSLIDIIKAE